MELFYRRFGQGVPLIILHGLYGSSDNWVSIAKRLESDYAIILPDQRNHGQSPHSPEHKYLNLVTDLEELIRKLNVEHFYLMGHSMGGRVAMLFQSKFPKMAERLVVVDVAPWGYSPEDEWFRSAYTEHSRIIDALKTIVPTELASRVEANRILADYGFDERLRNFLLKNLKRADKGFEWSINLNALENNLEHMLLGVELDSTSASMVNVLFIRGQNSNYIPEHQIGKLKAVYPKSEVVTIPNSGHWVHAEMPEMFLAAVKKFLG